MSSLVGAEMWLRIKAFLYDYLLILGYLAVLLAVGVFLRLGPLAERWSELLSTPGRQDLLAFATTVLPVVTYFVLCEASATAGTWGKKRVGLRVVGLDGERLRFRHALVRSIAKFAPWQMAHTAMFHIPVFPTATGDPPAWTMWLLVSMWVLVVLYVIGLTRFAGGRTLYDRLSCSQVIQAPT